jgi:hypothetical protein
MVEALVEAFARNGISEIEVCRDPEAALGHVTRLYDTSVERLKTAFRAYAEDGVVPSSASRSMRRRSTSMPGSPMVPCTIPVSTAQR